MSDQSGYEEQEAERCSDTWLDRWTDWQLAEGLHPDQTDRDE